MTPSGAVILINKSPYISGAIFFFVFWIYVIHTDSLSYPRCVYKKIMLGKMKTELTPIKYIRHIDTIYFRSANDKNTNSIRFDHSNWFNWMSIWTDFVIATPISSKAAIGYNLWESYENGLSTHPMNSCSNIKVPEMEKKNNYQIRLS